MKLRIRGNSLRLRLGPEEVAQLIDQRRVEEVINFGPDQHLIYLLKIDNVQRPVASFQEGRITVTVPKTVARKWADSELVGIEAEQELSNGEQLQLLIEKDFECLDASSRNADDTFPHPDSGTACRP